LESRQYQLARLGLLRMREQKWAELSNAKQVSGPVISRRRVAEGRRAAQSCDAVHRRQVAAARRGDACTNEALAHELLGERERAFALADKLRMQFPSSGRAVALWLNNAPRSLDAKALEEKRRARTYFRPRSRSRDGASCAARRAF